MGLRHALPPRRHQLMPLHRARHALLVRDIRYVPVLYSPSPIITHHHYPSPLTTHHPSSLPITNHHSSPTIITHHQSPLITHHHPPSPTITHYHPPSPTITHYHPLSPTITVPNRYHATTSPYHTINHHTPGFLIGVIYIWQCGADLVRFFQDSTIEAALLCLIVVLGVYILTAQLSAAKDWTR